MCTGRATEWIKETIIWVTHAKWKLDLPELPHVTVFSGSYMIYFAITFLKSPNFDYVDTAISEGSEWVGVGSK